MDKTSFHPLTMYLVSLLIFVVTTEYYFCEISLWAAYKAFKVLRMQEKKTDKILLLAFVTGYYLLILIGPMRTLKAGRPKTTETLVHVYRSFRIKNQHSFFNYGSGEIKSFLNEGY